MILVLVSTRYLLAKGGAVFFEVTDELSLLPVDGMEDDDSTE